MHARAFCHAALFALYLVLTSPGYGHRAEEVKEVQTLARGLKAASPADRIKSARTLGKLGMKARPAAGALCLAVADPEESVRHAALEALETVAPEIHRHVVTLAVDEDTDRHLQASASLLELGEKGTPAALLVREQVRLATTARGGKPAAPLPLKWAPGIRWFEQNFKLLEQLPDEQTVRVIAAVAEIDTSRFDDQRTVQDLRLQVVRSLEVLGKARQALRKPITRALLVILAGRDYQPGSIHTSVHAQVVRVLRAFGPDAREALPALKKLRYHPQAHLRTATAEAIKALDR